ncbi:hypothetical protein OIV83_000171 [Microbotryomycetes sp. JL201]|nr:hypothetical protein OIV83_000171 [Microbotryomycetes sp. JL201]
MSTPAQKVQQAGQQARDEAKERMHEASKVVRERAERAVDTVQQAGHETREQYINPGLGYMQERLTRHPFLTTFVSMFLMFSAVPLISFLMFSSATSFVVGGSALVFSLAVLGVAVGGASLVLGATIMVTSVSSFVSTLFVGLVYGVWRMMACMISAPTFGQGFRNFGQETRHVLLGKQGGIEVDTSGDVKSATMRVQSTSST